MTTKTVVLETVMGNISIELYYDHAPRTCYNFYELAKSGYYNGVIFHRVIKVSFQTTLVIECILTFVPISDRTS
jgi:cyclophilin family peptidyl-prolyl cis-trans isomerase